MKWLKDSLLKLDVVNADFSRVQYSWLMGRRDLGRGILAFILVYCFLNVVFSCCHIIQKNTRA